MLKRFLPFAKQIMFTVRNSPKIPYIYKLQIPNQTNLLKTQYNFCQNHKISFEDGFDHLLSILEQIVAWNDLEDVFNKLSQIVEYLEDNLKNFDNKISIVVYVEEIQILHLYQVAIYAYTQHQNPLNSELTQKLINCDLLKQLDIIKQYELHDQNNIERLKIQLNAASIMCNIINYGIEADINQLHDWMNDYLDQLEMLNLIRQEISSEKNKNQTSFCYDFNYLNNLSINFYFLIAQIHLKRNLIEEFERFIDQGIEEVKFQAERNIVETQGQLNFALFNLIELLGSMKDDKNIKPEFTINYAIKIADLIITYWEESFQTCVYEIRVNLAQFFIGCDLFDTATKLLNKAYSMRTAIDDSFLFFLYSGVYYCKQEGFFEDINMNEIITQTDNLTSKDLDISIILLLNFNMCVFYDSLETKDFAQVKVRFEKVIVNINELSKLIKEDKFPAQMPIFQFIDQVMQNDLLKNKEQFILSIYNALNQFKDIQLVDNRQNLEKDFYLIVLSFKVSHQINLNSQQIVKNVEKFAKKYIQNQEMQNIALNKLLLLNVQLIDEGKLQECQAIIDSLIAILSKENKNENTFIKFFQNQKNLIQRAKKNQ